MTSGAVMVLVWVLIAFLGAIAALAFIAGLGSRV